MAIKVINKDNEIIARVRENLATSNEAHVSKVADEFGCSRVRVYQICEAAGIKLPGRQNFSNRTEFLGVNVSFDVLDSVDKHAEAAGISSSEFVDTTLAHKLIELGYPIEVGKVLTAADKLELDIARTERQLALARARLEQTA